MGWRRTSSARSETAAFGAGRVEEERRRSAPSTPSRSPPPPPPPPPPQAAAAAVCDSSAASSAAVDVAGNGGLEASAALAEVTAKPAAVVVFSSKARLYSLRCTPLTAALSNLQ